MIATSSSIKGSHDLNNLFTAWPELGQQSLVPPPHPQTRRPDLPRSEIRYCCLCEHELEASAAPWASRNHRPSERSALREMIFRFSDPPSPCWFWQPDWTRSLRKSHTCHFRKGVSHPQMRWFWRLPAVSSLHCQSIWDRLAWQIENPWLVGLFHTGQDCRISRKDNPGNKGQHSAWIGSHYYRWYVMWFYLCNSFLFIVYFITIGSFVVYLIKLQILFAF